MMTNVDFEGFNDWSDKELIEAKDAINAILELRKKEKVFDALKKVESAMAELQRAANGIDGIDYFDIDDGRYSLADIFETIKFYYKERMM